MNNFSILIKNGTIIDGTGKKRYLSNIIIDEDKIAIIIGIEKYNYIHAADFAEHDSQLFFQYAKNILGVPAGKIIYASNEQANYLDLIAILKKNLFCLLDSQFYNKHLLQFGAYEISSDSYMKKLKKNIMTEREFVFLDDFQEVLSLIQSNNIKS